MAVVYTQNKVSEFIDALDARYKAHATNNKYEYVIEEMRGIAKELFPLSAGSDDGKSDRKLLLLLDYAALEARHAGKFADALKETILSQLFETHERSAYESYSLTSLVNRLLVINNNVLLSEFTRHSHPSTPVNPLKWTKRKGTFETGLVYSWLQNSGPDEARSHRKDWITENNGTEGDIMLGMIPYDKDGRSILKKGLQRGKPFRLIGSVMSVEKLRDSFFGKTPTSPEFWQYHFIEQMLLKVKVDDIGTAFENTTDVIKLLNKMNEVINQGWSVYIHCTAGIGAGPMVVAAYLAVYREDYKQLKTTEAVNKAYQVIKTKRSQINESDERKQAVVEVVTAFRSQLSQKEEKKESFCN